MIFCCYFSSNNLFEKNSVFVFSVLLSVMMIYLLHCHFTQGDIISHTGTSNYNAFAFDLFPVIMANRTSENVIYSPLSIQTCLAFVFGGAERHTAEEMRKVLKLSEGDKKQALSRYKEFLEKLFKPSNTFENDFQIKPQFNTIAQHYFDAQAENVDFNRNQQVVENINQWVERQTENKIKNLLQTDSVNAGTTAVLVNAVYFNAKWLKPFNEEFTRKAPFYMNNKQQIEVDMMSTYDRFAYARLPELEATALEMPYKDSDISMLIILPNEKEGLEKLETKLKGCDLNKITSEMSIHKAEVYLPKFRIEFDIDLEKPLREVTFFLPYTSQIFFLMFIISCLSVGLK